MPLRLARGPTSFAPPPSASKKNKFALTPLPIQLLDTAREGDAHDRSHLTRCVVQCGQLDYKTPVDAITRVGFRPKLDGQVFGKMWDPFLAESCNCFSAFTGT